MPTIAGLLPVLVLLVASLIAAIFSFWQVTSNQHLKSSGALAGIE